MRETETSAPSLGNWEANLEALSKAATPGPWQHIVGDDYYIESKSYPPKATHNPCVTDSGWWLAVGNRPSDYGEANSKFIVALVNAYRGGRMARAADAEHYMQLAESWKRVAERAGVCMTCALGAPDISIGCTDCLNTGFEHGAPQGYVSEAFHEEKIQSLRTELAIAQDTSRERKS